MVTPDKKLFNNTIPLTMHIDINSCFATIEQQFNQQLRNKPVVVVARDSPHGCIVAASIEAKEIGIKGGMRLSEAKLIYPKLLHITPTPNLYRRVHREMRRLFERYTNHLSPKSIDEFVLHFDNCEIRKRGLQNIAFELKQKIKEEVGDWIRVSIGIGPNRFLAKTAATLIKPDGLVQIDSTNYRNIFSSMKLTDLNGISRGNSRRLNSAGIFDVIGMYEADFNTLKSAFKSIGAYYWHLRLRGWEIDDFETKRQSFSHSYVLPRAIRTTEDAAKLLQKLVIRASAKMRKHGYKTHGIYVSVLYDDKTRWGLGTTTHQHLFDSSDIYKMASQIFWSKKHNLPIRQIVFGCFNLEPYNSLQLELFENTIAKDSLMQTIDYINRKYGDSKIVLARMAGTDKWANDSIAFGK